MIIAVSYSASAVNSPFSFLRYVSDARAAGLSGAFTAMEDDLGSIYFNPAAISTVESKPLKLTFLKHVLDINSGNAAYVHDIPDYGKLAYQVAFVNYGSFDYADADGNRTGRTFTGNELALGVSYSDALDTNFYYGVTLKYIHVFLEEVNTSALALDAGLFYDLPDDRTNIGLSLLHLGTQLSKINGVSEDLPLDLRLGVNHQLEGLPLLLNLSFHHLTDESKGFFDRFTSFAIGGELSFGEYVRVRAGYDNQVRTLTDANVDGGLTGFSFGAGVVTNLMNIDYSFNRYGQAANMHRFTISFDLDEF